MDGWMASYSWKTWRIEILIPHPKKLFKTEVRPNSTKIVFPSIVHATLHTCDDCFQLDDGNCKAVFKLPLLSKETTAFVSFCFKVQRMSLKHTPSTAGWLFYFHGCFQFWDEKKKASGYILAIRRKYCHIDTAVCQAAWFPVQDVISSRGLSSVHCNELTNPSIDCSRFPDRINVQDTNVVLILAVWKITSLSVKHSCSQSLFL